MEMRGQWLGRYQGATKGVAVVELDEVGDHFEGVAWAHPDEGGYPPLFAPIEIPGKPQKFELNLRISPVDVQRQMLTTWEAIQANYPGVTVPPSLQTSWEVKGEFLNIENLPGAKGVVILSRGSAAKPSTWIPDAQVRSWEEFKNYAVKLEANRYVFRGQESSAWRLRTYFHRSGRFNLMKFTHQDIWQLHAHLSSMTTHQFNLRDDLENAAFHSLAQHHGYPTPLLDWTHSPFIAAYFAFRKRRESGELARIFVLDQMEWQKDQPRSGVLSPERLHFSFLNPSAINNPRMVPQQALSTLTNIDDVEDFIVHQELFFRKKYLRVIDLPIAERTKIMHELSLMGITAGSMFPGLDGTCEQLKEKNFGY
jgi:hypothetical protein